MAGINKKKRVLKSGKEVVFYTISYRDVYGKQHTKGSYSTRTEAKLHLHEFENVKPELSEKTFGDIFKTYVDVQLPKYSHTTKANYDFYIKNHFYKLYHIKYDKVSSIDLQKFIDDIEKKHTPYVAQLCLKIARAVCNYALKHKLIKENKFTAVNNVIVSPQEKYHLTEYQERYLLKCCKELYPKYYAMFYTLMGTGMRIGELLALEITDINYKEKCIKVNKQFTQGKFKDGVKNTARVKKYLERDVYITDDLICVLKEHIKTLHPENKLLFPNSVNGYFQAENIRTRVWHPLLMYVGIKNRIRLHDLRGSYADIALDHGASIKFIQNQLGHSKVYTTLDIYTKNSQDMVNRALNAMNGILLN